jgi:hypothetical protein
MKMKLYLKVLFFLAIINLGCSSKLSSNKMSKAKLAESKLHHIVLFNFKETAPMDTIEKAMYELFGTIKGVNDLSFNKNVSSRGNLDKGYKHSFYMTFESEFVRDSVFYTHPNYKKIGGIIGPHINEYLIYDYWITEKK